MADSIERDTDEVTQPIYEGLNIHQRINGARGDVSKIEKTPKGTGGMKYDFIAHDDVTAHVKPIFLKWGICPWHTVVEQNQSGNRTELTVETDFINIDNPDDKITMRTVGYGADNQDKGPGKALTYAVKGAFLKAMLLNSADDIENSNVEHDPDTPRQSQVTNAEGKATAAQIGFAQSLKHAVDAVQSIEALDDLRKENRVALKDLPESTQAYFKAEFEDAKRQMLEE